ncbi:MAG: ankyrin repeat domain-containing protein [SAR324 cluster bacterium]|nr:ankyrin repeat domain-containing protein [SAR324 cluster bacterium]MBF0349951.1 ankyrin repeat domain-containing protein [SAR324 cluster bacterium]
MRLKCYVIILVGLSCLFSPCTASAKDSLDFLEQAFIISVRKGEFEQVNRFIESGINVNLKTPEGMTPLIWSVVAYQPHVFKLLLLNLKLVDDIDNNGYSALMWAAKLGHADMVDPLLKMKARLDFKDYHMGWDALMIAVNHGNHEVVQLLLEAGASPNRQDRFQWTPWALAKSRNDVYLEELLKKYGATEWLCRTSEIGPQGDIDCQNDYR